MQIQIFYRLRNLYYVKFACLILYYFRYGNAISTPKLVLSNNLFKQTVICRIVKMFRQYFSFMGAIFHRCSTSGLNIYNGGKGKKRRMDYCGQKVK